MFGTEPKKLRRNNDPQTSHKAAKRVNTITLEQRVYWIIRRSGTHGAISDEVRMNMPDVKSYSSVTARYKALKEKGLICYNGRKRKGLSGRNQNVMISWLYQ